MAKLKQAAESDAYVKKGDASKVAGGPGPLGAVKRPACFI
jgi:hypothetical protein